MGSIANLSATLQWDIDDFQRGTRTVEAGFANLMGAAGRLSDAVTAAGKKMTLGMTLPLGGLGVLFTKIAADAGELQSAFDYTFGGMASSMNRWSEQTGDAMGRATSEMQEGALAFGQLFKGAAENEQAAARLSQRFTELAQDAASFYNTDFDTAMGKIRSGLTGESEPLRDFGVFLTEADVAAKGLEMGLIKTGQELNEYGKVMARSALIAEGLRDAQGDVERTSDSLANRVRKIKGDLHELALEIGEILVPYAQKLAGVVESVVETFRSLPPWVKQAAVGFGVFLAAVGPVVVVLSSLATLILPLLLVRFLAMRGAMGPVLALFTAIVNPIGAAVIGFGKLVGVAGVFRGVAVAAGVALRALIGPLGVVIGGVALLASNAKTSADRTEELAEQNAELEAQLRAAGVEVGNFGQQSANASGGVNAFADSMDNANEAGKRLIQTLSKVAQIKELQKELDWIDRKRERTKGIDLGGDYVQVESGGFLGVGVRKKSAHKISESDAQTLNALDQREKQVARRMQLLALAIENGVNTDKPEEPDKNYALEAVVKPKKIGSLRDDATGPSGKELEQRREELRLEQALQVARIRGDEDEIRLLEERQQIMQKVEAYERAGLDTSQARVATEMDMRDIDQARAAAAKEFLAERQVETEYQVAVLNRDYEHLRYLDDEHELKRRIKEINSDTVSLANAEKIARAEMLAIEQAREAASERRLEDERLAHDLELARLRGDNDRDLRSREEDLRRRDRVDYLMDRGEMSRPEAEAEAMREAADRSQAHMQGTFRDAFRNGLQAAMDGNLGDFFEGWMRERTFNALSRVLDKLADSLANLIAGNAGGGGLFGSILGAFGVGGSTGNSSAIAVPSSTFDGPGFATGGSFRIKGYPGIDKNLLSLNGNPVARVSSGEIMDVRRGENRGGGGNTKPVVVEIVAGEMFDARVVRGAAEVVRVAAPGMMSGAATKARMDAARPIMPGGSTG